MIEQGLAFYVIIVMIVLMFLIASNMIPLYGFFRKRWKGLLAGCLLQPFIVAAFCFLVSLSVYYYQKFEFKSQRKAAMVSLRKTDAKGIIHMWYLKPDEECFYECIDKGAQSLFQTYDKIKLFDVVPLDSFRVCVDDKIVVRFDLEHQKATAAEHGEPLEVSNVNWDEVRTFFQNHP